MVFTTATQEDFEFLNEAIAIAGEAKWAAGYTPFGAVVVLSGAIVGRGASEVVRLNDATAHAEVMALREAGRKLADHRIGGGVMYASAEPCPLCLTACYWAGITRLVYAATVADSAAVGFEDQFYYQQLALASADRTVLDEVRGGGDHRGRAVEALAAWKRQLSS